MEIKKPVRSGLKESEPLSTIQGLEFCECLDALRAQVFTDRTPTLKHMHALNIRFELAFRCTLRVAAVVSKLRAFATVLTYSHDAASVFLNRSISGMMVT